MGRHPQIPSLLAHLENNRLILIDFGAAMEFKGQTFIRTIIGTPGYIAPEQSTGRTGFYSDIYAVGIIGIQAITGIKPRRLVRDEQNEIIWQPENTFVSQEFADILAKMVRTNKGDRYTQDHEILADIHPLENPIPSTIIPANSRSKKAVKSLNRKILIPSILLTLIGVPSLLWMIMNFDKSDSLDLPLNGTYTVITRTTSPGESGNYTVRAKISN